MPRFIGSIQRTSATFRTGVGSVGISRAFLRSAHSAESVAGQRFGSGLKSWWARVIFKRIA